MKELVFRAHHDRCMNCGGETDPIKAPVLFGGDPSDTMSGDSDVVFESSTVRLVFRFADRWTEMPLCSQSCAATFDERVEAVLDDPSIADQDEGDDPGTWQRLDPDPERQWAEGRQAEELIVVELDATRPDDLVMTRTPEDVWLRVVGEGPAGWPLVQVSGPYAAVERFVREHWGDEMVDDFERGLLEHEVRP